jgi:hypothetical protein
MSEEDRIERLERRMTDLARYSSSGWCFCCWPTSIIGRRARPQSPAGARREQSLPPLAAGIVTLVGPSLYLDTP